MNRESEILKRSILDEPEAFLFTIAEHGVKISLNVKEDGRELLHLAPEVVGLEFSLYTKAIDIWSVGVVSVEYSCGFKSGSED